MTSGGCTLPAELTPSRREEILEQVYRGGYRLRRIRRARLASAALAAVLVVVGVPALLLSSPGHDKTLHTAGGATTSLPGAGAGAGVGVVTPHPGDGGGSTSTTARGPHVGVPKLTTPSLPVHPGPPVTLVEQRPLGHWEPQASGTTETLRSVSFPDVGHGWVVGDHGTIIATTDGGAHWAAQAQPMAGNARFMDVSFVDDTHGWAVGSAIVATTDGGAHWVAQNAPSDPRTGYPLNFQAVSFVDRQHGWAIAWEGLAATVDGGAHWTLQLQRNDGGLGYGVFFRDATHGLASFSTAVMLTNDGGAHWSQAQAPSWYLNFSF